MKLFNIFIVSAALLASTYSQAETLTTKIGTLELPDGLVSLDRKEDVDASTGKPSGIFVYTKANDAPRAIFIVTYTFAKPDDKPFDARDAAVKIGNPFDTSLTAKDATNSAVGGVAAGRYEGTLPNGLRAISYAVENKGYRVVVLIKGPPKSPYEKLMKEFASAIEKMQWDAAL